MLNQEIIYYKIKMKAVTSEENALFIVSVSLKTSELWFLYSYRSYKNYFLTLFCISSDYFLLNTKNVESTKLKAYFKTILDSFPKLYIPLAPRSPYFVST